jgi:ferredoxin
MAHMQLFVRLNKQGDIMVKIFIDYESCDGKDCAECVDVCPMEIIIINGDKIDIQDMENCSLCEVCVDVCPKEAVSIKED